MYVNLTLAFWSSVLALRQKLQYCAPYTMILFIDIIKQFLQRSINLMLLIKKTEKVTLKRKQPKILKFSTALNGYVYISTTDTCMTEKLVHIDHSGSILWEKQYVDSVDTFGMFNEREVIVLVPQSNKIQVIDLQTHTVSSYHHSFVYQDTSSMQIYVFNDSKLFSVVEKGSNQDNRLFISYYTYQSESIKQLAAYKSQEEEWNYTQQLEKVNNHSKFAWWKQKYDETIDFFTYDLKDSITGTLRNIKININLKTTYSMNNFAIQIAKLWEISPHVYLLVCNTNRPIREEQKINNNYVLDAGKELIRETKFNFPKLPHQIVDFYTFGETSVFHTFSFEKGETLPSPVYYVHNEREEIIATEQWKATSDVHFYIPGFDTSAIIQAKHKAGNVEQIEVTSKRLMTSQEMYLHFLLHINQDFDDNLLEDAVTLLTD